MLKKNISDTGIQIITLTAALSLIIIILILLFSNGINKMKEFNSFHQNIIDFTTFSVQLINETEDFSTYKHSNKFYEYKKDESTEKVFSSKARLVQINKDIKFFKHASEYGILPVLKQNETLLNEFESNFNLLIQTTVEIGNLDFGYVNKINSVENRFLNLLSQSETFKNNLESIRNLKSMYIQTSNPEYSTEFIISTERFIKNLKNYYADQNNAEGRLIIDASAEYLNSVKLYFNLLQVKGNTYTTGLNKELLNNVHELIANNSEVLKSSGLMIQKDYKKFKFRFVFLISASFILLLLILFLFYKTIKKGFNQIKQYSSIFSNETSKFSLLKMNEFFKIFNNNIQKYEIELAGKQQIIKNISNDKFDESLSFGQNDLLGQSILVLQNKLKENKTTVKKENEGRLIEDRHKEGIAKFGRILRRHVGNIDSLTFELISELVRFIDAEIGGIFVSEKKGDIQILKLRASFAYNEKKLIQKEIDFGEGLIGTCALDKSTIFIDKVDDNYINVVSGFGHTKPTSIIISPIKVEEEIFGIIELAALRMFNEDDIRFVELIAEDIAYTLSYLLSLEKNIINKNEVK